MERPARPQRREQIREVRKSITPSSTRSSRFVSIGSVVVL
jgi:hypothetical protein